MSEYKEYTVRVYDNRTEWRVGEKFHREGGPAIEYSDGTKFWCRDDVYHREGGPAIEFVSGTKEWRINGKLHREDGPAVEHASGTKEWWIDGIELTEGEFYRRTNPPPCDGKVVEIEGRKYRLIAE
jgi:hypothetical protein